MSTLKTIQPYNNQDYTKIRDGCYADQTQLWEDTSYEATYDGSSDWEWKRPGQIVNNPKFVKPDMKTEPLRFDLKNLDTGISSDTGSIKHNIAALSTLTLNYNVFRFVVPDDNLDFSDKKYVGIFHFRFWKMGKFYDVVVDDRLPTQNGKLVSFFKDGRPVEFWPLLLLKAYAKLCGQMDTIGKITVPDFIVDLTAGISESFISLGHTKSHLADLEPVLSDASEAGPFVIFGRHWQDGVNNMEMEDVYCITKATYLQNEETEQRMLLLRIFMPFKTETKSWNGHWSDGKNEWKPMTGEKKEEIEKVREYEFLMPFSEFIQHDWDVYVVHLNPENNEIFGDNRTVKTMWYSTSIEGKWVRGVSSGGNRQKYVGTSFYLNPQYSISLKRPETKDSVSSSSVIISLVQKSHKRHRVPTNFYIFELKDKVVERLNWDFFKHNNPIVESPTYDGARESTFRYKLPFGEYGIVAAPTIPHYEAHFILRVLTNVKAEIKVLNERVAQKDVDVRVSSTLSYDENDPVITRDKYVHEYFEEVSGEEQVVGWKGLKKVLDFAMNYEKPRSGGYSVRNSIFSYMFPSSSVFDTMENKEFSKDLARSLLAMADRDHSGKLSLQEFQGLWAQVRQWIQIYEMYSDDNGFLSKDSLREALDSAGFQLSSDILCSLAIRYSNKDSVIPFDDFLMCASKLRTVFDYYTFKDPEFTDAAVFTLDEWLRKSIYS